MFASCLWIGYLPVCPGTFASLAALYIYSLMSKLGFFIQLLIINIIFLLGVRAATLAEEVLEEKDPKVVVIDEIVGYLITVWFLPFSLIRGILGFLIFRFYDIVKPFPVRSFEKIEGGLGIMIDDVIAGVYAFCTLRILIMLKP